MLLTDKQTNRQTNQCYRKHNLLCQGGKNGKFGVCLGFLVSPDMFHSFLRLYNQGN